MKNQDRWEPTKYEYYEGHLRAGRGPRGPQPASRLVTDLLAQAFEIAIPRYAKGRLLDLGCGSVPLYEAYRSHVTSIACVDWANSAHANSYLDLEWDLGTPLPFTDQSFDTIVLSDVLEHLSDPWLFWREANRLLAPGGHVILSVPFLYWLHEEPHDFFRYTRHALRRMAETNNFSVEQLDSLGDALAVATDTTAKLVAQMPTQGWRLALCVQQMSSILRRSRRVHALIQQTRENFPLAYVLVARRLPSA